MALSSKKLQKKRVNKQSKRKAKIKNMRRVLNTLRSPRIRVSEQTERLIEILGSADADFKEVPEVNEDTQHIYFLYLEKQLPKGMQVTGIEDVGYFDWEERFYFGAGSEEEYEELREELGSYKDRFVVLEVEYVDEERGVILSVARVTDKKIFSIPLEDLEGCDSNKEYNQLVDDYASWMCSYK
jgi:hypothetical protein